MINTMLIFVGRTLICSWMSRQDFYSLKNTFASGLMLSLLMRLKGFTIEHNKINYAYRLY